MSRAEGTTQEPGLLTAEDAVRPPPVEEPPAAPETHPILAPQPTGSSLSALPLPLELPAAGLPPGFVPSGPPQSVSRTPAVIPNMGGIYTNPMTPAAIPLPPSTVPTVHRLYTPSVAGSHVTAADPGVVIPPSSNIPGQPSRYSRTALQESSESSDDNSSVSSGLSGSMDTLTTPPQRKKSLKPRPPQTPYTPYATAPTPPDVTYPLPIPAPHQGPPTPMSMVSGTSRAARVPLPSSTVSGGQSPSRSNLSVGGSTTNRATRVPLPPSSAGSPRSAYTKLSRKGGSVSGSAVGRG